MNRRGFLGSLAALAGAKVVADHLPDEPVAPQPMARSGFSQVLPLEHQATTLTTNAADNWYHIDYAAHMRGEGIRWNYTNGVQS